MTAQPDHFELDLGVVHEGERLSLLPALLRWVEQTPAALLRAVIEGDQREDAQVTLAVDERRMVMMPIRQAGTDPARTGGFSGCRSQAEEGPLAVARGRRLAELSAAGKELEFRRG